jgi:hypothetical protein
MAETFTIESSETGPEGERASLTLRPHDANYFLAEVQSAGLHATAQINSGARRGFAWEGFGDFFAGIAANWKGRTGRREWRSLEGDLKLDAEIGATGRVSIGIYLHYRAPAQWKVQFAISIESARLDQLAAEARSFEKLALSAT